MSIIRCSNLNVNNRPSSPPGGMQKMTLLLFFVRLLNNYVGGSITNLRRQVISPENGTVHARTEQLDKGRRSAAGRRRSGVQREIFFFYGACE